MAGDVIRGLSGYREFEPEVFLSEGAWVVRD